MITPYPFRYGVRTVDKPLNYIKMGCRLLLALLVLHLCKVSCLCRCIVQRLGSADISVLAYNFWQATKASLLWGVAPYRSSAICAPHLCIDSHLCRCIVQRLCVAVFMHPCITAFCCCHYASLHSGFVWLTASILAWSGAVAPVI